MSQPASTLLPDRPAKARPVLVYAFLCLAAAVFLLLQWLGLIGLWQVYVLLVFSGSFQAFKFPAYSAATTVMVDKRHYGRASGMLSTAQSMSTVIAPVLAVGAFAAVGIGGVMALDIAASIRSLAPSCPPRSAVAGVSSLSRRR